MEEKQLYSEPLPLFYGGNFYEWNFNNISL